MAKVINSQICEAKAQNGARLLLDIDDYRILDGTLITVEIEGYV